MGFSHSDQIAQQNHKLQKLWQTSQIDVSRYQKVQPFFIYEPKAVSLSRHMMLFLWDSDTSHALWRHNIQSVTSTQPLSGIAVGSAEIVEYLVVLCLAASLPSRAGTWKLSCNLDKLFLPLPALHHSRSAALTADVQSDGSLRPPAFNLLPVCSACAAPPDLLLTGCDDNTASEISPLFTADSPLFTYFSHSIVGIFDGTVLC